MIKASLIDIGNVLVTFDYRRTFAQFAGRTPRSLDEIGQHLAAASPDLETGRLAPDAFVARAVEYIGGDVSKDDFRTAFTGIFQPIPAVWEIVDAIRDTVPVYLFSNTSELHETGLFRDFPGFSRFHGGFFSWRLGVMKPEPAMFAHALATLGVQGHEIAYIDDLAANIATGRRFGFLCHQYDPTRHGELVQFLKDCGLPEPSSLVIHCPQAAMPSSEGPTPTPDP